MEKLLLKGCTLSNNEQKDVLLKGDKIAAIENNIMGNKFYSEYALSADIEQKISQRSARWLI